jgi:hypothetical protein
LHSKGGPQARLKLKSAQIKQQPLKLRNIASASIKGQEKINLMKMKTMDSKKKAHFKKQENATVVDTIYENS